MTLELVLTIFIGTCFLHVLSTIIYNLFFHPLAKFPGPASRAAFHFPHALSKLRGTAYKDTKLLHDKYGTVVRVLPDALSYNTAQAWKDIYGLQSGRTELGKDPAHYKRDEATNIILANQTDHARIRKILAPAFSDAALLAQEPLLTFYFDLLISKLKEKAEGSARGRVDMMAYYNFVTFDIISDLVLGESFGALEAGEYHTWVRNVFESIKFLGVMRFAATFPVAGGLFKVLQFVMPSIATKRAEHLNFTRIKTEERLKRETDRIDFLTYILRHNKGGQMTDQELISNSRVLLTAGSETTATFLSGATYLLLQNPTALRRVQSEIRTVFKNEKDITLRSISPPNLLPYLEAVLQECLRCYPSIPATLPRRTGLEGALIDGKFVPGNTSVGVHQWSTYRSTANFAHPNHFNPERWLSDAPPEFGNDDKAALQPFSLGPRGCLGKSLAYFEMRSILARVLWNFDMEIDEASQGWMEQKEYTIWDKAPLWVNLQHKGLGDAG